MRLIKKGLIILFASIMLCSCARALYETGGSREVKEARVSEGTLSQPPEARVSEESLSQPSEARVSEESASLPGPDELRSALIGDWYAKVDAANIISESTLVVLLRILDDTNIIYVFGPYESEGIAYEGSYDLDGDILKLNLKNIMLNEAQGAEEGFICTLKAELDGEMLLMEHVDGDVFSGWDDISVPLIMSKTPSLVGL